MSARESTFQKLYSTVAFQHHQTQPRAGRELFPQPQNTAQSRTSNPSAVPQEFTEPPLNPSLCRTCASSALPIQLRHHLTNKGPNPSPLTLQKATAVPSQNKHLISIYGLTWDCSGIVTAQYTALASFAGLSGIGIFSGAHLALLRAEHKEGNLPADLQSFTFGSTPTRT